MTELARLKSQIAIFAGQVTPPQKQSKGAIFLENLPAVSFDAIYIVNGKIVRIVGGAQDMTDFALEFANHKGTQDTAIVCGGRHNSAQFLFCASHAEESILLRTQNMLIDGVFEAWRGSA